MWTRLAGRPPAVLTPKKSTRAFRFGLSSPPGMPKKTKGSKARHSAENLKNIASRHAGVVSDTKQKMIQSGCASGRAKGKHKKGLAADFLGEPFLPV